MSAAARYQLAQTMVDSRGEHCQVCRSGRDGSCANGRALARALDRVWLAKIAALSDRRPR